MAQYQSRIIASADDGYNANDWDYGFPWFTLGRSPEAFLYKAALRFQNVNIVEGTVSSASLAMRYNGTFTLYGGVIGPVTVRIYGILEENTDNFTSNPLSRTKTTAYVDWTIPVVEGTAQTFTSPDLSAIIQEIIDQGGWQTKNAIGFIIEDNGSNREASFFSHDHSEALSALLTINYTGTTTTPQILTAKSRLFNPRQYGVKIVKPGFPLKTTDPSNLIFDSDFGTLKYHMSGTVAVNNSDGCLGRYEVVNHNLGYYPYVEVFVRIDALGSDFVYAPAFQLGAKFEFSYEYEITTTQIRFAIGNSGEFADTALFKYFIFKNDLGL